MLLWLPLSPGAHRQLHQRHAGAGGCWAWRLARLGQSCRVEGFEDRQFQRMALAVDLHAQRALRLVDQEEQADHRIHRRPAADDAGQAGRHPGGGLGDLAGEQHQGFLARMPDGQLDHHFAAVLPSPMGTIGGFAAEQFDIDLAVGLPAALGEISSVWR